MHLSCETRKKHVLCKHDEFKRQYRGIYSLHTKFISLYQIPIHFQKKKILLTVANVTFDFFMLLRGFITFKVDEKNLQQILAQVKNQIKKKCHSLFPPCLRFSILEPFEQNFCCFQKP